MVKNATKWIPPAGTGYVAIQSGLFFQDNLGNFIIDNLGNFFVPTPQYVIGKYATLWSQS
jgi:hypothetical protein